MILKDEEISEVCLIPGDCYTFIIYDSFGDGICCDWGVGYYEITDQNGNTLVNGGAFASQESTDFCLDDNCLITADFDITSDSGLGDGAILITASNGIEEYQYSIDGGEIITYSAPFIVSGEGTHVIEYWSVDDFGVYETPKTRLIEIVPFEVTTTDPADNGRLSGDRSRERRAGR